MRKEIIRTRIAGSVSSAIIRELEENETLKDLIFRLGKEQALLKIYNEENITFDFLFQEYNRFATAGGTG